MSNLPFSHMVFVYGKLPFTQKTRLRKLIEQNGGKSGLGLNKNTTHFLTTPEETSGYQYDKVIEMNLKIVHPQFILDQIPEQPEPQITPMIEPQTTPMTLENPFFSQPPQPTCLEDASHPLDFTSKTLTQLQDQSDSLVSEPISFRWADLAEMEEEDQNIANPLSPEETEFSNPQFTFLAGKESTPIFSSSPDWAQKIQSLSTEFNQGLQLPLSQFEADQKQVANLVKRNDVLLEQFKTANQERLTRLREETQAEERKRREEELQKRKALEKAKEEAKRIKKEAIMKRKKEMESQGKLRKAENEERKQKRKEEVERRRKNWEEKKLTTKFESVSNPEELAKYAEVWAEENQRKLFIGNILMEDIRHACISLNIPTEEPTSTQDANIRNVSVVRDQFKKLGGGGFLNEHKLKRLEAERVRYMTQILEEAGQVERIVPFYQQKHCFVVYKTTAEAEKALASLSQYQNRKSICSAIRKEIVQRELGKSTQDPGSFQPPTPKPKFKGPKGPKGGKGKKREKKGLPKQIKDELLAAPLPSFYVRWNGNKDSSFSSYLEKKKEGSSE